MSNVVESSSVTVEDHVINTNGVDARDPEVITATSQGLSESISSPTIYTVPQLANDPKLLHEVVSVINTAYKTTEAFFDAEPRFHNDNELIEQFSPDGLCAIMRSNERIVATASISPWREPCASAADLAFRKIRPEDVALVEAGRSYEIKAVATLEEPATRKKGLATQCINALTEAILARTGGSDILLWLHTAEYQNQNGPYWRRRGFENVYVEEKPKGYWGAFEPFQFVTLVKRLGRG